VQNKYQNQSHMIASHHASQCPRSLRTYPANNPFISPLLLTRLEAVSKSLRWWKERGVGAFSCVMMESKEGGTSIFLSLDPEEDPVLDSLSRGSPAAIFNHIWCHLHKKTRLKKKAPLFENL